MIVPPINASYNSGVTLNRAAIYSRLKAPLSFTISINQAEWEASKRRILLALDQSVDKLVVDLSNEAIRQLRMMYRNVGRRFLANQWTNTPLRKSGSTVSITVYNRVENQAWMTDSNAPNSKKKYRMAGGGKRLLEILEGGARPHYIKARAFSNPLQFPLRWREAQSRSVGSVITARGAEVGRFSRKQFRANGVFSGQSVTHPGVVGSRFVDITTDRLTRNIESAARHLLEGKPL